MLRVYKLYVGLSQTNCSEKIDRDQVVTAVASCIDSFTVYDALGYFKGEQENTLVFTIGHEDVSYIKSLAYTLCVQLNQDGIGIEYDGGYHRMTQNNELHSHQSLAQHLAFNSEAGERLS